MDVVTAAQILNVAADEVLEVRLDTDGWWALQEDQASHERNWRPLDPSMDPRWWLTPHPALVTDPVQAPVDEPLPDPVGGSSGQIMDWVGSDKARAAQALAAVESSQSPDPVLIAALQKVIDS